MIDFKSHTLDGDVLVITVTGELGPYTSSAFFDCLEGEIENGHRRIIVDCSHLHYLSSVGIGSLVRAHTRMKKHGGDVKLAALQGPVADVLRVTHLDKILAMYPDVESAHRAFK